MLGSDQQDLTGVWEGLFSYPRRFKPTTFTAVIFQTGSTISGTIHEQPNDGPHAGLTMNATISGERAGGSIQFFKTYEPIGGKLRSPITYAGLLNSDSTEIEGQWVIPGSWSGKFLMIRTRRVPDAAEARHLETVPRS